MGIFVLRFPILQLQFFETLFEALGLEQLLADAFLQSFRAFLVRQKLVLLRSDLHFCMFQLAFKLSILFCKLLDVAIEVHKELVKIV